VLLGEVQRGQHHEKEPLLFLSRAFGRFHAG
jgi:hypothetical protein